jgi:hypothetical protein
MKVNKTFFALLTSLVLLTGCWGLTFTADTPNEYTQNKNMIESLYGSTQEDIIRKLGEPKEIVKRSGPTDFIYQWRRNDVDFAGLILPIIPILGDTHLYCFFLEFDETNQLNKHASVVRTTQQFGLDCIDIFYQSRLLNHKDALRWLCRAADQGNNEAQYLLALFYETGSNGVTKDLVKSYMWYQISAFTEGNMRPTNQAQRVWNNLTAEQSIQAETLLRNWKPGQCERELVPINTAD